MIFYHLGLSSQFEKYGLPIPLNDDRSERIYHELKDYVRLIPNIPPVSRTELEYVHEQEFLEGLESDELYQLLSNCFEFSNYPPSKSSFNARSFYQSILFQVAATCFSVEQSVVNGFAFHLGGGMHHALTNGGRGFCLLNDIVIAIRRLQHQKKILNAWVIDVDAHKGDGTAQTTKNDNSIRTLSIHMKDGWPLNEGDESSAWFIPSDIDIPVGECDNYLSLLKSGLEKMKEFGTPDLAIIVNGSDPYEKDELPSSSLLKLTKEKLLQRDMMVYEFLKEMNIPQCYLMAGGYGKYSWEIYCQFLKQLISIGEISRL